VSGLDAGLAQNLLAGRQTDAEDVGQADLDALLARKVDTSIRATPTPS
jgi:hypothetical protein